MIRREAEKRLIELSENFKAVAVTGPRQSGKTTLVKHVFGHLPYFSLENPDTRQFATEDPKGFLSGIEQGAVIDEVQRTPGLFSWLQGLIDQSAAKGRFILTGSNNFLLQQSVSQTLAGRIAYLNLLPFSLPELQQGSWLPDDDNSLIHKGFYPPVHDQAIPAPDWMANYIRTYVERDVRQVKNITDLLVFERFLRLLAGRTGQELNYSALAVEAGIDTKTVQSWIGILENSFIIFLLRPHYKNFRKSLVKKPKMYFYDTGLACSLLGIYQAQQLENHPLRGAVFETMVVSEVVKHRANRGILPDVFFWRDKTGHEIDLIMEDADAMLPVEIKSGRTITADFFKNLRYWMKLSGVSGALVLYAGDVFQHRSDGIKVKNWRSHFLHPDNI
ncbi:MAG TPA: ATP-binding protein [Bacteroidales bacterium]|nr:ATP-binding protein [Bacteroidales bacterium]HSA42566.1 ATP-binding protein [Bacteroidales bacterium]